MQNNTTSLGDLAGQLEELAGLINFRIGAWQDFGYENPPGPGSKTIPPLGKRSVEAIIAGHGAVAAIDTLVALVHETRSRLGAELRQDEDLRAARIDAMLAASAPCGCPRADGQIRHQREICIDPVVASLDWYAPTDVAAGIDPLAIPPNRIVP